MHRTIIKPVKQPPKLDEYADLSDDAQRTIRALKIKYTQRINEIKSTTESGFRTFYNANDNDASANYYKSIYDATFKREIQTPDSRSNLMDYQPSSSQHGLNEFAVKTFIPDSCENIIRRSMNDPLNSNNKDFQILSQERRNQSYDGIWREQVDVEISPQLNLSPAMCIDVEDVFGNMPSPKLFSESPINLNMDNTCALNKPQQDTRVLSQSLSDYMSNVSNTVSADNENLICLSQNEDPLKSCRTTEQRILLDLSNENPFSENYSVQRGPPSGIEKDKVGSPLSPVEADFDLRLSGFSPFDIGAKEFLNSEEIPFTEACLQKDNGNTAGVPEDPLVFDENEETLLSNHLDKSKNHNLPHKNEDAQLPAKRNFKRKFQDGNRKIDNNQETILTFHTFHEVQQQTASSKCKAECVPKRMKSKFLPPRTLKPSVYEAFSTKDNNQNEGERSCTDIEFFSLSKQEQDKTKLLIELSEHLSITALHSNGQAMINTFYTAADHAKRKSFGSKNSSFSTSVKSVVVMTQENCSYRFEINAQTVDTTRIIMTAILSNVKCEKSVVNAKDFLIFMLRDLNSDNGLGISCEKLYDPVIASWLLNPDVQPSSFMHLCCTAGFSFDKKDWLQCLCTTQRLMQALKRRLIKENLWSLYKKIEMRLVPLLAHMECCSLKIDMKTFIKFSDIIKGKIHKLEEKAYNCVGHKFSINSHAQLRQVLYNELKLDKKISSKSKIGKTNVFHHKSTSESALNLMIDVHPLPSLILEYRSLQKMVSTYVEGLMTSVSNDSISTHWDQTAAATGRLTSSQPNIQTVPKTALVIKGDQNHCFSDVESTSTVEIFAREPFISRNGYMFLAADFQQIEFRILAHLSDDKTLLAMFWKPNNTDVFTHLTSEWLDKPVDCVTTEDREQTKRVVYSVMYGVGKDKLAEYLKITPDQAKNIMQSFLVRFPCINAFSKKCVSYAEEYGYTETLCGRRRHFPHIKSSTPSLRAQAQRQAVNFCVQGSAADICKLAMLAVESKLLQHPQLKYRLLLQIHDELVWEVSEKQLHEVNGIIASVMEDMKALCSEFCDLQVPLTVSFTYGKSWAHLIPLRDKCLTKE